MICCLPIFFPDTLFCLSLSTSSFLEDVKRTRGNWKFEKYAENSRKPETMKTRTCFEKLKNNTRVTTIFFFYVKLNLHLKFIILIKTQANVLFWNAIYFLSVNIASPGIIAEQNLTCFFRDISKNEKIIIILIGKIFFWTIHLVLEL